MGFYEILAWVVGALVGAIIVLLIGAIMHDSGREACLEATGAEQCVREWRAVE